MIPKTFQSAQTEKSSPSPETTTLPAPQPRLPHPRGHTPAPGRDHNPTPPSMTAAVTPTGPQTGLQSRRYRQHRIPYAPDPPDRDETPDPPPPNQAGVSQLCGGGAPG